MKGLVKIIYILIIGTFYFFDSYSQSEDAYYVKIDVTNAGFSDKGICRSANADTWVHIFTKNQTYSGVTNFNGSNSKTITVYSQINTFRAHGRVYRGTNEIFVYTVDRAYIKGTYSYVINYDHSRKISACTRTLKATINFKIDDPVYLTASSINQYVGSSNSFYSGVYHDNGNVPKLQYCVGSTYGTWKDIASAPSGGYMTCDLRTINMGCPDNWFGKDVYFRVLKTLESGTLTYGNIVGPYQFYDIPTIKVGSTGNVVCSGKTLELLGGYLNYPSCDPDANIEVKYDGTWRGITKKLNTKTILTYEDICGTNYSYIGKEIEIRTYKTFKGTPIYNTTLPNTTTTTPNLRIVFLPTPDIKFEANNPTCYGIDNANFTIKFNNIPEEGFKNPVGGAEIPLYITIYKYTVHKIADDDTYSWIKFPGNDTTYYYWGGSTIPKTLTSNILTISNADFTDKFKIGAGKYKIEAKFNTTEASCSSSDIFTINEPPQFSASAASLKLSGTTYSIKTGELTGTVNFSYQGGSPPYYYRQEGASDSTKVLDSGGRNGSSSLAKTSGTYYYFLHDQNGCYVPKNDVTLLAPTDISFSNPSSSNVMCNAKDVGDHANGSVSWTVSGGVLPYSIALYRNGSLVKTSSFSNGAVSFSDGDIAVGNYAIYVSDKLNTTYNKKCDVEKYVDQPVELQPVAIPVSPKCPGQSNGSLTLSASGGTLASGGSYSFTVKDHPIYTGTLSAGKFDITVSDDNTCTKTLLQQEIKDPAQLFLTATYTKPASCQTVHNGKVKAIVENYQGVPTDIKFSNSAGELTDKEYDSNDKCFYLNNLSDTDNSTFTVNDKYCSAADSVKIPLRLPAFSISHTIAGQAPCTGKNGTVTISALNGELYSDQTYKYSIDGQAETPQAETSKTYALRGNSKHNFTVKDGVGCSSTVENITMEVRNDSLKLNQLVDVMPAACTKSNSGIATVNKISGTGTISFKLMPTNREINHFATATFDTLYPKLYKVIASDIYQCKDSVTFPLGVWQDSLAFSSYNTQRAVCKESSPTGALKVSRYVGGRKKGKGAIDYTLNLTTQSDSIFSKLKSGWYTITAHDALGCEATISDSVKFDQNPVNLDTMFVSHQICSEIQNAKIKLKASTKKGSEKLFRFAFGNDTTAWHNDTISYKLNLAGTYTFKVIDKNNCGSSLTQTINNLNHSPQPLLNLSLPVACKNAQNGSLHINNLPKGSVPGYKYKLGNITRLSSNPDDTVSFINLGRGLHKVVATDAIGCRDSANFLVDIERDSVHIIRIDTTFATCKRAGNGKAKVVASSFDASNIQNKYSFTCNGINLMGDSVVFAKLAVNKNSSYKVVVQDGYGCKDDSTFVIGVKKDTLNLDFKYAVNAACPDSSDGKIILRRFHGNPGWQYSIVADTSTSAPVKSPATFNSSDTIVTITGLPKGKYSITVTDAENCKASVEKKVIDQPKEISFWAYNNNYIRRKGDADGRMWARVWLGNSKYVYEWRNSKDNAFITSGKTTDLDSIKLLNRVAGEYVLRVQDTARCWVGETGWLERRFTIVEPDSNIRIRLVRNKPVSCYSQTDGEFEVKASGGWGTNYTYGLDSINTYQPNIFSSRKADTLTVYAKDTARIVTSMKVIVTQPGLLVASFDSKTDANCYGSTDGNASINIKGGNYPYYFVSTDKNKWIKGNFIDKLDSGIYTIHVKDTLGCYYMLPEKVIIGQPTEIKVDSSRIKETRCKFANGSVIAYTSGGVPALAGYNYDWSLKNNLLSFAGNKITNLYSGIYNLKVTDSHKCSRSFDFVVSDSTNLTIEKLDSLSVSCWGYSDGKATIQLAKGNPPYTLKWSDGTEDKNVKPHEPIDLKGLAAGIHRVYVEDSVGCISYPSFTIGSPTAITLEGVTKSYPLCEGVPDGLLKVEATGSFGGYSYLWNNGKKSSSINNLEPGNYNITITDSHNCFNSFDFSLQYQYTIKPSLGSDLTLCKGNSFRITPGVYRNYKWTSDAGQTSRDSVINVVKSGNYFVEVVDNDGCVGRDTIKIGESQTIESSRLLMASSVEQNDTVVIFVASWPFPDSVQYKLNGCKVLSSGEYFREVVFPDTGTFTIGLTSYLYDCLDITTKPITVEAKNVSHKKSASYRLIQNFVVSPNPNSGEFQAEVRLLKTSTIFLRIANLGTGIISDVREYKGSDLYNIKYNLNLPSGTYLLHLQAGGETKTRTIIIQR